MLYTDSCCKEIERKINSDLSMKVIRRFSKKDWTINECMRIIPLPDLEIAVINVIDEISVMEISLLAFMCKPILITNRAISEYPMLSKVADYINVDCNLNSKDSPFVEWYKQTFGV